MKLRIRGDSLRLRLTKREVDQLRDVGEVREVMRVAPGEALEYVLVCDATAASPRVTCQAGRVQVRVPKSDALAWAAADDVGIESNQDCGDGAQLRILIEKDFQCLTAREGEDDSDAFANPNSSC